MKRASVSFGAAFVLVLVALPVSANAPADQYLAFVATDDTITDSQTGLEWDRHPGTYPPKESFQKASDDCAAAGKRLPSLKELLTIVDEAPHLQYVGTANENRFIDVNAFSNTPSDPFWTSSLTSDNKKAYVVDFTTGLVEAASTGDQRNVRCVK